MKANIIARAVQQTQINPKYNKIILNNFNYKFIKLLYQGTTWVSRNKIKSEF